MKAYFFEVMFHNNSFFFGSEENMVDPEIAKKIDIGFPQLRLSRSQQLKERLEHLKQQRSNKNLEKDARNHSCKN